MKGGIIEKASDWKYYKEINVPDEVCAFFEKLCKEYDKNKFVVDVKTLNDGVTTDISANMKIIIYDDYIV